LCSSRDLVESAGTLEFELEMFWWEGSIRPKSSNLS
jgi:hypothetical protein